MFFIPKAIWTSKSLSNSELVGDYLTGDHGFGYNNLSNSMVLER